MIEVRDNVGSVALYLYIRFALRVVVGIVTVIGALVIYICKYRLCGGKLIVSGESGSRMCCGLWIQGVDMVLICLDHAG